MSKLYLASKSPRRRELLAQHGFDFEVLESGVDDAVMEPGGVTPGQWAAALAYLKAAGARQRAEFDGVCLGGATVLGADTIVVKRGRIVGQAYNEPDAERMIELLENGEHEVITGIALIDAATGRRSLWSDRARVSVGEVGAERIRAYAASGGWRGKAGAYNLAERLAEGWPIQYEGDPG
ncbi:MAG: Maf family protein, partial [Phycisphaerales bacterium]|nr:Maf family protein [Phycisphaerales bacterium]